MEAWTKEKAPENQNSNHQFVSARTLGNPTGNIIWSPYEDKLHISITRNPDKQDNGGAMTRILLSLMR